MKIKFITFSPAAPASIFYYDALKASQDFTLTKEDGYDNINFAFFMTYQADLKELQKVKRRYPELKTAIIDPRGEAAIPFLQYADFLIIDSIEMRDYFARFSMPMFTYYEYPRFKARKKVHKNSDNVIIGYHGNKVHLTATFPKITSALALLAEQYQIEFWAIYDVKNLGRWDIGRPKNVAIRHIQWHEDVYSNEMAEVDIGIVPSTMPVRGKPRVSRFFLDSPEDYVLKFKMPSNPGRLAVFAQLGIPVVADFLPTHFQFIEEGDTGFLADSTGGWYHALKKLIESHELRAEISERMTQTYEEYFNFERQNKKLFDWLSDFPDRPAPARKVIEEKQPALWEELKFRNAFLYEKVRKIAWMIRRLWIH